MEDQLFDFISTYISLTEEEKEAIQSLDIFRTVKKGTILLREGQRSHQSYFVLKGCIRTYYLVNDEEKTTAFYTEMEGFTPAGVQNNAPSAYYVACVEDCILTVSTPNMEAEVFEKFPRFESLCRVLSEQLLTTNQNAFDAFKTSSPEQRYRNLMENRPDLLQRVPQHQLASYLGITPQSLSRMRSRMIENDKKS